MFKIDKFYLETKAKEYQFNRDTLEKVSRLYNVLRFLNTHPLIKDSLALKGGTAINFTMLELPRLSVDIDLDFICDCNKEEMIERRLILNQLIHEYMMNEDYMLSPKSKQPHTLDSFVYRYLGQSGNFDNLKIEINYSLRSHIDETDNVYAIHPVFVKDFQIHRLSIVEIYAGKISALLTRSAARDLYDVSEMIKHNLIKKNQFQHLKKSILFYLTLSSKYKVPSIYLDSIDKINQRMILRDLKPVLSKTDKFDLEERKIEVKQFLNQLLWFNETELKFLELFSMNQYEPSLLFDDKSILNRIKNHPMALWKTRK